MKIFISVLLALITCGMSVTPSSEIQGIEKALNYYLEGESADEVGKAFHPAAELKFVRDGKYEEISAEEFLNRIRGKEKPQRITRIRSIQHTGNAASACVEQEYETHKYIDYINLLKADGEWKIVNKIFEREAKGAAPGRADN